MKKILLSSFLAVVLVAPFAVSAQEATSTNISIGGGHRRPFIAGFVDSISNKGAWILSNSPVLGQLLYVAEHPELKTLWAQIIAGMKLQ